MIPVPKKCLLVGLVAILLLALSCIIAWPYFDRDSTATISPSGGEARDERRHVAVHVAKGGVARTTRITFKDPEHRRPSAPIDSLLEVIAQPVDIVPDGPLNKAAVAFTVDASKLASGGIQVFNPKLGWVPLETRTEGNQLVADAPHFSEYRAVAVKPGTHGVKVGNRLLTFELVAGTKPLDMFTESGAALARQMYLNTFGIFDAGKFKCEPKHTDYVVTANKPTRTGLAAACVVARDQPDGGTLLIKNSWALPLMFRTDATAGVVANAAPGDMEAVTFVRNVLAKLHSNIAFASGLDVGSFTIGNAAPDNFTITGRVSWSGVAVDIAMGMLTVFFPGVMLASQVDMGFDALNCVATAAQKLYAMTKGDIPGHLAELLNKCMVSALVERFGVFEMLKAIGQELKLLPALAQVAGVLAANGLSGADVTFASFTVARPSKALEWLQGDWLNDCGGRNHTMHINGNNNGTWQHTQYGPSNNIVEHGTASFRLELEGTTPIIAVTESRIPGVRNGARLTIQQTTPDQKAIMLEGQGDEVRYFFRKDLPGSPC